MVSTNPSDFDANITVDDGGEIRLRQRLSNPATAGIYVRGSAEYGGAAILLLSVQVNDPPDLAAAFDDSRPVVLTGYSGLVATVNSGGGLGNYSYGLIDGVGDNAGFTIGATDGRLSLTDAQDTPTTLTVAATVNDEHPNTPALTLSLTLRVVDVLVFTPDRADIRITTYQSVPYALHTATVQNPSGGDVSYSLLSTFPANFTNNINFTPSDRVVILTAELTTPVSASIYIRATTATEQATLVLRLAAVDPPPLAAALVNASAFVLTGYVGDVASLSVSGGVGAYTYSVGDDFAVDTDGLLRLALAQSNVATLTATVVIDDSHDNTAPITAGYTLLVVEQLRFTSAPPVTIITYDTGVIHTAEALGGIGDISYIRASANPPALSANFNVGSDNGEIRIQQALTTPTTLSLYIRALERLGDINRLATLLLTVAAVDPPPLAAALVNASAVFLAGETGVVASLSVSGGVGAYTYAVGGDFTVGADGLLSLAAGDDAATLTATVTIDDSHDNTVPVNAFLTLTIAEGVSFAPPAVGFLLTTYADSVPFTLHRANLLGGLGTRSYALVSTDPSNFDANITVNSGGDIIVTQTISVRSIAGIYIRGSAEYGGAAILLLSVQVNDPPDLAAAFDDSRPIVLIGYSGLVATVNSGGGLGNYRYGLIDGVGDNAGFTIGATDGRLSLTESQDTPTILTAAATVNDEHPNISALTLSLTLRVVDALIFTPDRADIRITTYRSVPYALHTATVQNPSGGDVSYSLLSTFPANFTDSINFTPSDRVVSLTAELTTPVSASIYIRATTATEQATLVLRLAAVDPPPLAATLVNASAVLLVGETGVVASLSVSGGGGTYTYSVGGDFAVSADGLLSLASAQSNVATLTATVTIDDEHADTTPITAGYTLLVVEQLRFASAPPVTITTYDRGEVFYTAEALGGIGDITYLRVSANPPAFTGNFDLFFADGEVFLQQALTTATTLSLYIEALEQIDGTDRRATLLLTVAAVDPPPLAAALVSASAVLLTGETGVVASLSVSGGGGAYTYSVGGDFAVGADGLLSLTSAQSNVATLTATVTIEDSHENTAPVSAFLTLTIAEPVSFAPPAVGFLLTTYADSVPFTLHRAILSGGAGARGYAVDRQDMPLFSGGGGITVNSSGDIIVTQTIRNAGNVGIYVRGSAEYGGAAILAVFVNVADPPPLAAAFDDSRPIVLTGQAGLIAQVVSVSGGRGSYSYGLIDGVGDNAGFTIGATDGRLSLTDAQDTPTILTAVATADDGHPNTPAVALSLTLRVVNALAFTPDRADIRLTTYQSVPFALHTATVENPSGGEVSYSLLSVSPPDFADNISFTPSDRIVNLTAVQTAPVSASIYIRASTTTELATLVLQLAAVNPPPLAAAFDDSRPIVLTGYSGLVATVNSGGGLGNYSYGLIDGAGDNAGFAIGVTDGRLSLTEAEDTPTTLTAAATVNDEHPNTPAVTLSLTLRVVDVLAFSPDRADIRITTYQSVPYALHTATVQNPSGGEVSYSLLSTFPANFTDNINFTPSDRIVILTADLTTPVSASIYIRATTATERATLVLQLAAVDPPPLAATWDNAGPTIFPDYSGLIAQVVDVRGGLGNYSYGLIDGVGDNASFTIGAADGRLSLTEAQDTPTTLTAAATVNDEHPNTPALTLTLTLAVPARPVLADASGAAPLSYTGGVASVANAPSGKWTLVFGDDNFTLGADGILRLTTAIGVSSVLTVSIAVDAPPLITLGYTLTIALCSFFDGCQPLVNYSGAGLDFDSAVWDTITEPLALSLVAAGADVNERLGNNTPLLMLARLGRPAAAAVLLANGAEVNVTGSFVVESVPSSAGVLHYMIDNATLRHVPLINLFIANGVDVNHRLREDGVLTDTPLDGYNRFTAPSELPPLSGRRAASVLWFA